MSMTSFHRHLRSWTATWGFPLLLALGCSRAAAPTQAPTAEFLRATPIIDHGPPALDPPITDGPALDPLADATSTPGGLAGSDGAGDTHPPLGPHTSQRPHVSPTTVIAEANALASQSPEADGFLNAVMTYTFLPGAIFKVYTAPDNVTDLVLEPGEDLMGPPAAGDTLRWKLAVGTSAVAGTPQKHVFIKPTRAGLSTNLTLNTNRRTYFLKLESVDGDFMVAVQWSYPQSQSLAPATGGAPATPEAPVHSMTDVASLNFDYAIEVTRGKPAWKPEAVYDNGEKTFIRFDPGILHGESPALFVIERGALQIVNYRVKENLYVVDRLFELAELRLGQEEQDVVRLRNRRAASAHR